MQLLNIATTSIALFGFGYFLFAFAAHLAYRWQQPIAEAKSLTIVKSNLAEVDPPTPLLLLPAATEVHPWEVAADRLLNVEPILAVVPPTEPSEIVETVAAETPELPEVVSTDVAIAPNTDLTIFSIRQLKQIASERKLPRYSSMTKPQLIAALS